MNAPAAVYLPDHFDLLHVGQLSLIRYARSLPGRLVAGVVSDAVSSEIWGHVPVVALHDRIELVRHLIGVDEVVVHGAPGFDVRPPFDVVVLDGDAQWDPAELDRLVDVGVSVHRPTGLRRTGSPALTAAVRRRRSAVA